MDHSKILLAQRLAQGWERHRAQSPSDGAWDRYERELASCCAMGDWDGALVAAESGARGDRPDLARPFPALGVQRRGMPIQVAAMFGREDLLEMLLNNGAWPGSCWAELASLPLFLAIDYGHVGCCRLLLEAGADPNARGASMWSHGRERAPRPTPLQEALWSLASGPLRGRDGQADIKESDQPREEPSAEIIELLLASGADARLRGSRSQLPIESALAAPAGLPNAAIGALLKGGAKLHLQKLMSSGALEAALDANHPGRLLEIRSILPQTPPEPLFDRALEKSSVHALIDLLEVFGARPDLLARVNQREAEEIKSLEEAGASPWIVAYQNTQREICSQNWARARAAIERSLLRGVVAGEAPASTVQHGAQGKRPRL
jgi:hypothetical protein